MKPSAPQTSKMIEDVPDVFLISLWDDGEWDDYNPQYITAEKVEIEVIDSRWPTWEQVNEAVGAIMAARVAAKETT